MTFNLELSQEAYNDIEEIVLYYSTISKELSDKFQHCLYKGLSTIESNPLLFQNRYNDIFRIHFIDIFPFGIHYYVREYSVIVIGLFHTSRNPELWDDRTEPSTKN